MSPMAPRAPRESFAVLGYGRFGRAFAELLAHAGHGVRAFDPAAKVPRAHAAASASEAVEGAQWVVLAMPVTAMRATLEALRPALHAGQIVIDVGSVKLGPCAMLDACLGAEIAHVGTHPLFGPLSLARGDQPLRVVTCPSPRHPDAARRTRALFVDLGCEVVEIDPERHDRAMAHTHALAFFVAKGLLGIGTEVDARLAPPSFAAMANMVAAVRGDAGHLFATIESENPFAGGSRELLLAELKRVHEELIGRDIGYSI